MTKILPGIILLLMLNALFEDLYAQTEGPNIYGTIPEKPAGRKPLEALSAIDLEIGQFMKEWSLPGGSVALVKDGKLLYAKAFGKADINVPTATDHLFRIASLSKPITAIAIMKLVEEGKLSLERKVFGADGILNDPIYRNINDKRIEEITVRNLLQHTAGWDRTYGKERDPMFNSLNIAQEMGVPAPADEETIIQYMLTKRLDFKPGSRFVYSNLGYSILGRVIEKIAHTTYEAYVLENILDPLEIVDMSLGCNVYENKQPKEVVYHALQELKVASVCEDGKQSYYPYGGFNLEAMDAHGGWLASAKDLAKIIVASNGSGTRRDLLTPETVATMMEPCEVYSNYGLGWCVNELGNRWHTGSLVGASSMMASLNNGIGWVMLFNGNPLSAEYFKSMDKVMWKALGDIKEWPSEDLFMNPSQTSSTEIEGNIVPDLL